MPESAVRLLVDVEKLRGFMREIGRSASGPGKVYLVGGATALLLGFRPQTIDIDLKLDPEPPGVFDAIARLKEKLGVNVEIASPDHFIPPIPGWQERSMFIAREGLVDFYHYDLYGQALAKIQRGHGTDLSDVRAMIKSGGIDKDRLLAFFEQIKPMMLRYPAINLVEFEERVKRFFTAEAG